MHPTLPAAHCSKHRRTPQQIHRKTVLTILRCLAASHHAGLTVRFPRIFQAHAHFIGIDPAHRGAGLGARLYEHFSRKVKARGCTLVHAVTSPVNTASVAFHRALGFETVRVASRSGGRGEEGAGAGVADAGPREAEFGDDGVVAGGRGSVGGRRGEKGAPPVDSEFVHVGYDGPDDGDRVVMEMRL